MNAQLTRRTFVTSSAALAAVWVTSACSGGSVTGNAGGGGSGKTTVTVWGIYSGNEATEAKKLVSEFNSSQDTITVDVQYFAPSDQFGAKLINAIKNGIGPDMVLGDGNPQQLGQIIATGKVVPLDPYLTASDAKITKDSFTPGMLATGTFDGTVYSLPSDVGDYAVVYNKQLFADAGISSPPTTWAELATDAKRLTKGTSQYGMYLPIGSGEWPVFTWQSMLWSAGGEFLSADNKSVKFNSDAGVQALTAWTDMIKNGSAYPQSLMTTADNGGTVAMTSKKAAMAINGAYNLATLDQALGADNVGVFALPGIKQKGMNLGTNNGYLLSGPHQDASWQFMQFWLDAATQATWDIATGLLPANVKTAEQASWKDYLAKNPRIKVFADELTYAKSRPSITQYNEVSAALSEQLEAAMLLKKSPKEALDAAATKAQAALG